MQFTISGHGIDFRVIDIADPNYESEKDLMMQHSEPNAKGVICTPQIFNEEQYCGVGLLVLFSYLLPYLFVFYFKNYQSFENAIESEELYQFLKLAPPKPLISDEKQVIKLIKFRLNLNLKLKMISVLCKCYAVTLLALSL